MWFYTTLDIIGDYFTKALQGYQFSHFQNIILGFHEDYIFSYIGSRRALIEELNIKLERAKEDYKKATKLTGEWVDQGVCWERIFNEPPMYAQWVQAGMLQTNIICCMRVFFTYIVWCQLTHLNRRWRHLWYVYTNVSPFRDMIVQMLKYSMMVKYSLVECRTSILYDIIDRRCVEKVNLSCLTLFLL